MKVRVSTGGFSKFPADEVSSLFQSCGIDSIELSGGTYHSHLIGNLIKLKNQIDFEVHNYFPPPAQPFVFNLASMSKEIADKSISHVVDALKYCQCLGSDFYSFHAGYLIDPEVNELGAVIGKKPINDRDACKELFVQRVSYLAKLAEDCGVRLMIENNVLSSANFKAFSQNPLLMCDPGEIYEIASILPDGVGLLLDVAHLKVSAKTLGFRPDNVFQDLKEKIYGYHLSDNDGFEDSNESFDEDSWFWGLLNNKIRYCSIEVYKKKPSELSELVNLTNHKLL